MISVSAVRYWVFGCCEQSEVPFLRKAHPVQLDLVAPQSVSVDLIVYNIFLTQKCACSTLTNAPHGTRCRTG